MGWMKVLRETPKWIIITTMAVLVALVYFGLVRYYFKIAAVGAVIANNDQYSTIWNNLYYAVPRSEQTYIIYIASIFICILLGLICLFVGIARSINKLDGKTSYLMAAFLVLFTFNTFSMTEIASVIIEPGLLFIIHWITYFIYPFPFFLYIFFNLRPSFYKWTWPLFFLPVAYFIATWIAYLTAGLPFEAQDQFHTTLAVSCFILLLTIGFGGAVQKNSLWYVRIISLIWLIWIGSVVVRILLGYRFRLHDEVVINVSVSAVVSVGYLVFDSAKEIFTYKSNIQMLETQNGLLLENYQRIESYISQISLMKHEIHSHLLAIKTLFDGKEYERIAKYLDDIQESYMEQDEPVFCGHRLIQSILSDAKHQAQQIGVKINFKVTELPSISITDSDVVRLLRNLLNNALESCEKVQPPDKRWVTVTINCQTPYLYISVKNVLNEKIKRISDNLVTTKKDAALHGHGVLIVQEIAKKYNGLANFENTEDSFSAVVALCVIAE